MPTFMFTDPLWELISRLSINCLAMILLIFGMYYRRYRDKELATAASMFNVFTFAVLTILSSVQFSIAAGFGLFAILALFSLRSEAISKIEISYFFGAIAIAVICSVLGTTLWLVAGIVSFVLLAVWALDHPRILKSVSAAKVTLDKIDPHVLSDTKRMKAELSSRLGVNVMTFQIIELNYVNDLARLNVYFRA